MLCVGFHMLEFKMAPTKRRSFCKEFKLKVTNWYFENGKKKQPKEGKRVKRWWFNAKAIKLVKGKYSDEPSIFKLSQRWFEGYCRRYKISLRRKTCTA